MATDEQTTPASSPAVLVGELLHRFGITVPSRPAEARQQLLEQKVEQLQRAMDPWEYPSGRPAALNVVAVARGLADVVLTAYGTAALYGIQLDPVIDEVHLANLTRGTVSDDDVAAVLAAQHDDSEPLDRNWWEHQVAAAMGESWDAAGRWLDEPVRYPGEQLTKRERVGRSTPWELIAVGRGAEVWKLLDQWRGSWDASGADPL